MTCFTYFPDCRVVFAITRIYITVTALETERGNHETHHRTDRGGGDHLERGSGRKAAAAFECENGNNRDGQPTHAYILFLAGGQGLTVSDSPARLNQKTAAVSEAIRRQFPDAAIETEIVNTGNRDFGNSDRDSFAPDVTRLIQVTIPADARRAAQILDIALRMGLTPFLASLNSFASDQLSCSGAIFYGIRNLDADVDRLCETAYPQAMETSGKAGEIAEL